MKLMKAKRMKRIKRTIQIGDRLVPHIHGGADANNAQIGAGVTVNYWSTTASPPAYTTLGKLRSVNGIGAANPEVESTTLDSQGVDRIAGLPDGTTMNMVFTNTAATLSLIEGFVRAKTPIDLRVTKPAPSSNSRYFSVLPLSYDEGTMEPNSLLVINFGARITGAAPSSVNPHP